MKKYAIRIFAICALSLLNKTSAICARDINNESKKPNIVIILCDDLGYNDVGCYGQQIIPTPNIDSLARNGIRFSQAYASSPVSAPSRASLLTGQHTGHTLVRGNREFWRDCPTQIYAAHEEPSIVGQLPLDPNVPLISEIFLNDGYDTAMFGKWGCGHEQSSSTPDKRGFNRFYGYICQFQAHAYFPNFLNSFNRENGDTIMRRITLEENINLPMHGSRYLERPLYSPDLIHSQALQWIDSRPDSIPFFALLSYTLPHAEIAQPRDSILLQAEELFPNDVAWHGEPDSRYNIVDRAHAGFAAQVMRLDKYVGDVVDLLNKKGIAENTLLIFTSDNGPHNEGGADPDFFGYNAPIKGIKRSCHEGGIRIPFIAYMPGYVPKGQVSNRQIIFYDLLPTLSHFVDIDHFEDSISRDGISFAPELRGHINPRVHDFLYWEFEETDQIAIRSGDWKMIVENGIPRLYDLSIDLHEDNDIARLHPQIVDSLTAIILREHTPSPIFHVTLPSLSKKD